MDGHYELTPYSASAAEAPAHRGGHGNQPDHLKARFLYYFRILRRGVDILEELDSGLSTEQLPDCRTAHKFAFDDVQSRPA